MNTAASSEAPSATRPPRDNVRNTANTHSGTAIVVISRSTGLPVNAKASAAARVPPATSEAAVSFALPIPTRPGSSAGAPATSP